MKDHSLPISRRDWAASQAAPYVHPRLNAIDQTMTLRTDPLSELMREIDGRTTGIRTGLEDDEPNETLQ